MNATYLIDFIRRDVDSSALLVNVSDVKSIIRYTNTSGMESAIAVLGESHRVVPYGEDPHRVLEDLELAASN